MTKSNNFFFENVTFYSGKREKVGTLGVEPRFLNNRYIADSSKKED